MNKLGPNSLDWLRTRIGRIEAEIALYDEDPLSCVSGERALALANSTLFRLENALMRGGPTESEIKLIEENIKKITESQWGCEKKPERPW